MSKLINKTEDATLWELIGFPTGFVIGLIAAVTITVIVKGWSCVA